MFFRPCSESYCASKGCGCGRHYGFDSFSSGAASSRQTQSYSLQAVSSMPNKVFTKASHTSTDYCVVEKTIRIPILQKMSKPELKRPRPNWFHLLEPQQRSHNSSIIAQVSPNLFDFRSNHKRTRDSDERGSVFGKKSTTSTNLKSLDLKAHNPSRYGKKLRKERPCGTLARTPAHVNKRKLQEPSKKDSHEIILKSKRSDDTYNVVGINNVGERNRESRSTFASSCNDRQKDLESQDYNEIIQDDEIDQESETKNNFQSPNLPEIATTSCEASESARTTHFPNYVSKSLGSVLNLKPLASLACTHLLVNQHNEASDICLSQPSKRHDHPLVLNPKDKYTDCCKSFDGASTSCARNLLLNRIFTDLDILNFLVKNKEAVKSVLRNFETKLEMFSICEEPRGSRSDFISRFASRVLKADETEIIAIIIAINFICRKRSPRLLKYSAGPTFHIAIRSFIPKELFLGYAVIPMSLLNCIGDGDSHNHDAFVQIAWLKSLTASDSSNFETRIPPKPHQLSPLSSLICNDTRNDSVVHSEYPFGERCFGCPLCSKLFESCSELAVHFTFSHTSDTAITSDLVDWLCHELSGYTSSCFLDLLRARRVYDSSSVALELTRKFEQSTRRLMQGRHAKDSHAIDNRTHVNDFFSSVSKISDIETNLIHLKNQLYSIPCSNYLDPYMTDIKNFSKAIRVCKAKAGSERYEGMCYAQDKKRRRNEDRLEGQKSRKRREKFAGILELTPLVFDDSYAGNFCEKNMRNIVPTCKDALKQSVSGVSTFLGEDPILPALKSNPFVNKIAEDNYDELESLKFERNDRIKLVSWQRYIDLAKQKHKQDFLVRYAQGLMDERNRVDKEFWTQSSLPFR